MQGHQLAQQVFGLFNLYFYNPLLVVLPSDFHFSAVRGYNKQGEEHKLEDAIDHIGLQIKYLELDEEEVLGNQSYVQDDLYGSEYAERNGSWDDNDGLVYAQRDLLRRAEKEVLELWSVQNEEDHREGDSDDLNNEEDHNALWSQSSHVVQKSR